MITLETLHMNRSRSIKKVRIKDQKKIFFEIRKMITLEKTGNEMSVFDGHEKKKNLRKIVLKQNNLIFFLFFRMVQDLGIIPVPG